MRTRRTEEVSTLRFEDLCKLLRVAPEHRLEGLQKRVWCGLRDQRGLVSKAYYRMVQSTPFGQRIDHVVDVLLRRLTLDVQVCHLMH
ncbi:hypothetical protein D3C81_1417480 [compost metagenome]